MTLAGSVLGVCMVLAAAPDVAPRFVPVRDFTLAWTHSIEKLRWEEDYVVMPPRTGGGKPVLVAGKARIRGSGAGMEPPPDATFKGGWYEYQPQRQLPDQLRLTRSAYTADYEWCENGSCKPLSAIMPTDGGVTLLYPCRKAN
ncbi:DUF1850 domain-containing protein [Pollutimonas thiosulfatoxidans]|nr:DUF1850 domain-containing protein [Pollutimonas thiosulfatoxidans]